MANTNTALLPVILSRAMAPLRERCPMARTVFSDFASEVAEFGDTIKVKIWPAASTSAITPGPVDPTPSNTTPTTVSIALSNWMKSDFHLTDKELMEIDANVHFIPPALDEATRALANEIETDIATALKNVAFGYVGTAGTTPFATTADAINARKTLALQLCPAAPRYGVINADAEAAALTLAAFQDATRLGTPVPRSKARSVASSASPGCTRTSCRVTPPAPLPARRPTPPATRSGSRPSPLWPLSGYRHHPRRRCHHLCGPDPDLRGHQWRCCCRGWWDDQLEPGLDTAIATRRPPSLSKLPTSNWFTTPRRWAWRCAPLRIPADRSDIA